MQAVCLFPQTFFPLILICINNCATATESHLAEVIGPIVGSVMFVTVAATVTALLILLCLYRRYGRTAKMPMKKKTDR